MTLTVPEECKCPCHSIPALHIRPCCEGQCPVCKKWFVCGLTVHLVRCTITLPRQEGMSPLPLPLENKCAAEFEEWWKQTGQPRWASLLGCTTMDYLKNDLKDEVYLAYRTGWYAGLLQ
jgi:hypothetical protein